jgi:hypothetical protein
MVYMMLDGRSGLGAVMGSKKLKGILFQGDRERPLYDVKAVREFAKRLAALAKDNPGVKAYKIFEHRHTPEIEQELSQLVGKKVSVTFVPHLIPMDRGILTTLYVSFSKQVRTEDVLNAFHEYYKDEPLFVFIQREAFPIRKMSEVQTSAISVLWWMNRTQPYPRLGACTRGTGQESRPS